MEDQRAITGLKIDVGRELPAVGDRRRFAGSARLALEDVYDLEFLPGDQVEWRFDVRRVAGGLEVTGGIDGVITLVCYRCLETFDLPLSISVREHALWLSEAEMHEAEEPAAEYMVTDGVLDLEPIIRDSIALSLPAARVCDEGCRGLCQQCGANLNVEPCGCVAGRVDARLRPLEELKRKLESEGRDGDGRA